MLARLGKLYLGTIALGTVSGGLYGGVIGGDKLLFNKYANTTYERLQNKEFVSAGVECFGGMAIGVFSGFSFSVTLPILATIYAGGRARDYWREKAVRKI